MKILPLLFFAVSSFAMAAEKPNIILILADDMGFSDLGCYGSEISTPNLDALAAGGVRFGQFYNSARCCPTRVSLLTGLHPHQAGIGHMTQEPEEKERSSPPAGYLGHINNECATIAQVLHGSGYATFMTGKWHLGQTEPELRPLQRGFDRYYGILAGATNYFKPQGGRGAWLDNAPDNELKSTTDQPYYTTDAFADHAIQFIRENDSKKPFFLYLAFNAPHWPLQAPESDIAKYRGKYKIGWDELRKQRYAKQLKMGLIDPKWALSPRDGEVPAWDTLTPEKQDEMDLRMSIYAAMIDHLDQKVGQLVASLKEQKLFDNTLIMFLSDNGACAEMGVFGNNNVKDIAIRNAADNTGYGMAWANASSTPFRLYKHFAHEGGSATPFFAHWPAGIKKREGWVNSPGQIIDVMPTLMDITGARYPSDKTPLQGVSLKPVFDGGTLSRTKPLFIEHENNAFVRDGDWKLVGRNVAPADGLKADRWQLYNLADDRTELKNLAKEMPDKVKAMSEQWLAWANASRVYPKDQNAKKRE